MDPKFQVETQWCNNETELRDAVKEFWSLWLKPLDLHVNGNHQLWVPVVEIYKSSDSLVAIEDDLMDAAFMNAGNLAQKYTLTKVGNNWYSKYYLVQHSIEEAWSPVPG